MNFLVGDYIQNNGSKWKEKYIVIDFITGDHLKGLLVELFHIKKGVTVIKSSKFLLRCEAIKLQEFLPYDERKE